MTGILKETNQGWFITLVQNDNGILFGVDYPLQQSNSATVLESGKQVDFELITIDNADNGIEYAKLV